MTNNTEITTVNCPVCQTRVEWTSESHFRPFCSKRCQLIDLGDWASEEHRIYDEEATEHDIWSEDEVSHFTGK